MDLVRGRLSKFTPRQALTARLRRGVQPYRKNRCLLLATLQQARQVGDTAQQMGMRLLLHLVTTVCS